MEFFILPRLQISSNVSSQLPYSPLPKIQQLRWIFAIYLSHSDTRMPVRHTSRIPMNAFYKTKLEQNIRKYSWYKIFTKRVYLPLITIQLVNVGQVTLKELAIIAIVSSVVQALLQMPAGYIADKIGNRKSIILGSSIAVVSPLLYAFMPSFWGGMIASILFFGGYAFQSGAIEAFVHDTLIALRKEKDYAKVMGRAQTYGLVGNILLVTLVPLTYAVHHTLPFILGTLSLLAMLGLTISFEHPPSKEHKAVSKSPLLALRTIVTKENILLFIFSGFMAGVATRGSEFRELVYQHIGIKVGLFGFLLAIGSLLGALFGWYIHLFDRLKAFSFYLLDLCILAACLVFMGLTESPIIIVTAFVIFAAYGRVRMIIFQAKMLHEISHGYKATLISALNVFTLLGDFLAISLLTKLVTDTGYLPGHALFGGAVFLIGGILWLLMVGETKYQKAKLAA